MRMKSRKEKLLDGLDLARAVGAEIGPLHNPLVSKLSGHVIYIDRADTESLRQHYANDPAVNTKDICVDAVWGVHTLAESIEIYFSKSGGAPQALDYVVASHVIEHVPDLVSWLQEIRSILKSDGEVRLAVPDRRFTFDYLRRPSNLSDVMTAYASKARIPTTHCLLDFCLNVIPVDSVAAWQGTLDTTSLKRGHTLEGALSIARDALENGTYHDVHCWVFTPTSFAALFAELSRLGLIDFACGDFYDTQVNDIEFIVNMRVCDNAFERTNSWHHMSELLQGKTSARAATRPNTREAELALE
ncbi:MAG: methyltransferase domain-containing protein [Pseudomonadota bacterium]